MLKNKKIIIALIVLLLLSTILNIRSYNQLKAEHLKEHNSTAHLILNLHNTIQHELSGFVYSYNNGRLDDVEVKAHHRRMLNICKLKMGDGRFFGINHMSYIVPYEISEVDTELIERYIELEEYLYTLYLEMPSSTYDVDEKENDWEYINRVTQSDEYDNRINEIIGISRE